MQLAQCVFPAGLRRPGLVPVLFFLKQLWLQGGGTRGHASLTFLQPLGRTCDDFSSPFPPCWLLALSPPAGLFNHCPSKPTHFRSCKQEEMVEPSLQPLSVDLAPVGMFWLFEGVGRRKWAACAPASRSWGLASRGPAVR